MVVGYLTTHRRADVHNMGESFNRMKRFDLYRTKLADSSKIVSAEIHQHIVFGKLFFVSKQFCFESFVFFYGFASRSCPCKWKSVQYTIFQFYQRFRRSTCHLNIRSGEIEHIR